MLWSRAKYLLWYIIHVWYIIHALMKKSLMSHESGLNTNNRYFWLAKLHFFFYMYNV